MTSVVKKVVEAIYHSVGTISMETAEDAARAALEALREPSKIMCQAGDAVAGTLAITHDCSAELTWQAMINEALK
jgi:hypothetical protein